MVHRESGLPWNAIGSMRVREAFYLLHCYYVKEGVPCRTLGAILLDGKDELADMKWIM